MIRPATLSQGKVLHCFLPLMAFLFVLQKGHASGLDNFHALDVPAQFDQLQTYPEPLGARLPQLSDDVYDHSPFFNVGPCRHYQGLARGAYPDGTPAMFIVRSRNRTGACATASHQPGELLTVRFGAAGRDGERLGNNRLAFDLGFASTAPPAEDTAVNVIYFDGVSQDSQGNTWPYYEHPGGAQLIDDVLVVAFSDTYADHIDNPAAFLWIDVKNPDDPILLHWSQAVSLGVESGGAAITQWTNASGEQRYLFAGVNSASGNSLEFWESDNESLRDPVQDDGLRYLRQWNRDASTYRFDTAEFNYGPEWGVWQTANFIRDRDGSLYLILGDNDSAPLFNGGDYVALLRVNEQSLRNEPGAGPLIELVDIKRLRANDAFGGRSLTSGTPNAGDLDAGGAVYVTPTGQMVYYTLGHTFDHTFESPFFPAFGIPTIQMGEFKTVGVNQGGACGPVFRANHLGGPYTVGQNRELQLNAGGVQRPNAAAGNQVYYVEPFINLFEHCRYNLDGDCLQDNPVTETPGKSVMVDSRYLVPTFSDDFADFTRLGFNDEATSYIVCSPPGGRWVLCENTGCQSGDQIEEDGDGIVRRRSLAFSDLNDEISAAVLLPGFTDRTPYWDLDNDGEFNDASGDQATFVSETLGTRVVALMVDGTVTSTTVEVVNVAPLLQDISVFPPDASDEGEEVTATATFSDVGASAADFSCQVDYGEGAVLPGTVASAGDNTWVCTGDAYLYRDNLDPEITVSATDAGGETGSSSVDYSVKNADPLVSLSSIKSDEDIELSAGSVFVLPGMDVVLSTMIQDPGADDTFTASINWGNGPSIDLGEVDAEFEATFAYILPGNYGIQVAVTDDDGGEDQQLLAEISVLSMEDVIDLLDSLLPSQGTPSLPLIDEVRGLLDYLSTLDLPLVNESPLLVSFGEYVEIQSSFDTMQERFNEAEAQDPALDLSLARNQSKLLEIYVMSRIELNLNGC